MSFLSFGFSFEDLHQATSLHQLDDIFMSILEENNNALADLLKQARHQPPADLEESTLLLDLAPYVEDFIGALFDIKKEIENSQDVTFHLAPLYRCKRLFIQRQAAKAFSKEEAQLFDGPQLQQTLARLLGEAYSDLTFARSVLKALENGEENKQFLEIAKKFAAWSIYGENPSVLFRLPRKKNPEALISLKKEGNILVSPHPTLREGFNCTDPGMTVEEALNQAHYCILCHPQGKDSCSKGLSETQNGCPLDQKISEMNTLRIQGHVLAALAVAMIDNPMIAATGHRICNDCVKACIFQKQDGVDVPGIETEILESVLNLPWGVEIYSLLSRWNPLNLRSPFPKPESGYTVLVAGMGPAGFTLAHYLLNEGHRVVAIDGLKIEPLDPQLLTKPIREWSTLKTPLSQRAIEGFGGVAEYGITARWDKNYLKLIRLLLERRSHFTFYDGIRLGSNLTLPQAFKLGFDHVALCLGAGNPRLLEIPKGLSRGVRLASDFLMALQLTGAAQKNSLANLQIRLPILVVGGGLTAIDTATEALAYYRVQVEKFLQRTEDLGGLPTSLSEEEKEVAEEFLTHAYALRQGDTTFLKKACTLVYRKQIQDSPSYLLNPLELKLALNQGVSFLENTTPTEVLVDSYGHIENLIVHTPEGVQTLACRTLLVATGTEPNSNLEQDDSYLKIEGEDILISYQGAEKVSFFGDLHPKYGGSVVKAMASAKDGYPKVCQALLKSFPSRVPNFFQKLNHLFQAYVEDVQRLTPSIVEVIIKAPQAALNFKPGQFFRLQNYGPEAMEGIALTGAYVDPKAGHLSLIALEMGASSSLCQYLKKGERVVLMGPTGTPTEIPTDETVLLIGEGLGNAVLFSIGKTLKEERCRILYVAGYKQQEDLIKVFEIETISDHVVWCFETLPEAFACRPQDFVFKGNVLEGLLAYVTSSPPLPLSTVDRVITIGPDKMMAAVACARKTILKPYLSPHHKAIGSINSPMQCMMKGMCGQCIQTNTDPLTGKTRVVFCCRKQDQNLDEVNFDILHNRLKQNSLLEKQTRLWAVRQK